MIQTTNNKPLNHDPSHKSDRKGQRQGDKDRHSVIGNELLHHIAGVGSHHNEFTMGHVDNSHDAKSDRQTNRSQKEDRRQRQRVQCQICKLCGCYAVVRRVTCDLCCYSDLCIWFFVQFIKHMPQEHRITHLLGNQSRNAALCGQGRIGRFTRQLAFHLCQWKTRNSPLDNIRFKGLSDIAYCLFRGG